MNVFHKILDFMIFQVRATNAHGIHSPFVYDLYGEVLSSSKQYYCFGPIESLRASYLLNNTLIPQIDYGAGGQKNASTSIAVNKIAGKSLQTPKNGALLLKLIDYLQPSTIIELGTSLGITTSYMAMANSRARVFSIEGNPHIAALAREGIKRLKLSNVEIITGQFEDQLPGLLASVAAVDFVLFDGNHRYAPTMDYFLQCLERITENSVFVFDDIYWSQEMKAAWAEIINHPRVTLSIDCYELGMVFFRNGRAKEHFLLRGC